MIFGITPYDLQHEADFGYRCILKNNIKMFLDKHKLTQYTNSTMISLLNCMLNVDDNQRFNTYQVLQHQYFTKYLKKYSKKLFSQK